MPIIFIGSNVVLPFAINMVSSYIFEKMKGREEENAKVNVTFIVRRENEEKELHYNGDAKAFREAFEKVDLNNM